MSAAADRITGSAPGRINIIGEHTDYNNGFALPIALEKRTEVTFVPDGSTRITLSSNGFGAAEEFGVDVSPGTVSGWAAYPAGVVWALRQAGHPVVGGRMSVSSDVPVGAGLSSSAALECAVLTAMNKATGLRLELTASARIAQRAENDFVGAPTGMMDQLASLHGDVGKALLIDFAERAVEPVAFEPEKHGLTLLVVDSHAPHHHSTGEYASRRQSCAAAARELGVDSLREVQHRDVDEVLERIHDVTDKRRVRHVLTENRRVLDAAAALQNGDFGELGRLMTASHVSMRDDFQITTAHIDFIADTLRGHGALGARMTGGGFGGCVIAVVKESDRRTLTEAIMHAIVTAGYPEPTVFVGRTGVGAH